MTAPENARKRGVDNLRRTGMSFATRCPLPASDTTRSRTAEGILAAPVVPPARARNDADCVQTRGEVPHSPQRRIASTSPQAIRRGSSRRDGWSTPTAPFTRCYAQNGGGSSRCWSYPHGLGRANTVRSVGRPTRHRGLHALSPPPPHSSAGSSPHASLRGRNRGRPRSRRPWRSHPRFELAAPRNVNGAGVMRPHVLGQVRPDALVTRAADLPERHSHRSPCHAPETTGPAPNDSRRAFRDDRERHRAGDGGHAGTELSPSCSDTSPLLRCAVRRGFCAHPRQRRCS